MAQIIPSWNWGGGWSWASYTAWTWIDISAQNEISIDTSVVAEKTDLSWFQTTANMVTSLTWADNDHYPTAKAVADAITGWGNGDVLWPNSSTDWDIVLFDWATGKQIKDSWKSLSDYQEKLTTQTAYTSQWWASKVPQITTNTLWQVTWITEVNISYPSQVDDTAYAASWDWVTDTAPSKNAVYDKISAMDTTISSKAADSDVVKLSWNQSVGWTKTFTSEIVLPSKTTTATNDWTKPATEAQVYNVANWLWTAASKNTWTSSGNVPVLDVNWKLDTTILPWVALTDTFTVTDKSDLTSLSTAEQWDIWIVTSESKTYVLSQAPYSTLANWKELLSPTDAVTSVNSKTWAVTLDADDISDSTTTNKFVTSTEKSTWSWKQDALTLPATPTQWNLVVRWANNKTIADWWAIPTWYNPWNAWNTWQVLTKTAWGYEYADAPVTSVNGQTWAVTISGWITNDTTGTTSTVTKIWAWTEAEYALITPNQSTIYYVF